MAKTIWSKLNKVWGSVLGEIAMPDIVNAP